MFMVRARGVWRLGARVVRLSTFCTIVLGATALLGIRSVFGAVEQSALETSTQWLRTGALDGSTHRVRINGEAVVVSSHMVDGTVARELDAAEAECRAHAGGFADDEADLRRSTVSRLGIEALGALGLGIVRREADTRGSVACLLRDGGGGLSRLAHDVRDLMKTGDLAAVGTLLYVEAERGPAATRTHVVRLQTEGSFHLTRAFPASGDAPGADLAGVPRPLASQRVLDASLEGSPFGVRVYTTERAPEAILARYDRELAAAGWRVVDVPEEHRPWMRVYDQSGADVFVAASRAPGSTVVSITDMPAH